MKNLIYLVFVGFVLLAESNQVFAQKSATSFKRCGTMDRVETLLQLSPALRNSTEQRASSTNNNARLQAIVTVPVVVHIVLPNPWLVTDADVQTQIDRLNLDFSGLNPDSTNAGSFMSLRGHSQIRFCLARRTPSGQLTNGIERRASSTGSNLTLASDPIKHSSDGGLDIWDPNSYLNLWVGIDASGQGILGYAHFPGITPVNEDGVFLYYQTFGSSSCYTLAAWNKGRTGSHEVGHYFGLLHIWGDDGSSCTGDDFRNLNASTIGSTVVLPANLANAPGQENTALDVGDTPNQANETTTCPTGNTTDACATTAPGKMYQNFMDYTQDACYSMFTKKQVERMEWIVENARAGLKTSLGCTPPAAAMSLDIAPLHSVNPGGFEFVGCTMVSYPNTISCTTPLIPKFRVVNNGLTHITSITVGYIFNGGAPVTQTVAVNIPSGGTTVVSLPAITPITGPNSIRFFTSNPNGSADAVSGNDTLLQNFTVTATNTLPQTADFETATFPPAPWSIFNPHGDFTWERKTPGRNGSAGEMWINNYDVDNTDAQDEFRSSNISVAGLPFVTISFDLAHKYYPLAAYYDTLTVLVSGDCGASWTNVYQKWGPALGTAGSSVDSYTTPVAADWRSELITLSGSILSSGQIIVAFRNTSRYGNNIHIDNINIAPPSPRDFKIVSISNPGASVCSPTFAPQVIVNNNGLETISSFKVGYRFDNGPNTITTFNQTILPGANATITLPVGTASVGTHNITAFVADPVGTTGTGDNYRINDTLTQAFTILTLINPPVVEGFENTFPPAGWTIVNPDNNVTWTKKAPGSNSINAAFIDNFDNSIKKQIDDLKTPFLNVSGADSVVFSFDLAHRNYNGANDTLMILATTDCGNSYTAVFKKWGSALATAGNLDVSYTTPSATDWKNQRISLNNSFSATGSIGFLIRNSNDYGNNIFIDNVNIYSVYKRDVQLLSVNAPASVICSGSITPSVTLRNVGMETITSVTISYSIDNGPASTTIVTGLNLASNTQVNLPLSSAINNLVGVHSIRVYSWAPVSSAGTGDLYTFNDTLNKQFYLAGTVAAPLTENFTSNTFPPTGWSVINPDGNISWAKHPNGSTTPGSAFVNTYKYIQTAQRDDLVSPNVTFQGVDSVTLTFDLAAATKNYPGSTTIPIDTLAVLISKDCGNTFTTVYKKWGEELQTIADPNNSQTTEFVPQFVSQWRQERIDLTGLGGSGPLMVFFRVTNNNENNIFIDNINLTTRILPDRIKQQGYLVLPSPFQNSFNVWHVQDPVTMKYINVYNSLGQLIWTKQFDGNGQKVEMIDLTGRAAGVYLVKIGYEGKQSVTERVVKY